MSAVADGIDFVIDLISGKSFTGVKSAGVDQSGLKSVSGATYAGFVFMWLTVWHKLSQKDFSAIITCAAVVQCAAFVLLSLRVRATKSWLAFHRRRCSSS